MKLLPHRKSRIFYFILAISLFLIEVSIEQYFHDGFIRYYLGDFLVVILIYAVIMAITNLKVLPMALFTLIFSYAIETAQFFKIIEFLGLENIQLARVVIGTSFSWMDLVMYTMGILTVLLLESWSSKATLAKK